MLILALRDYALWPLLDWSGAVLDGVALFLRIVPVGANPAPSRFE